MAGDCTAQTCPVKGGYISYEPSVGGNAFLLAAFATLLPVVVALGLRFRIRAFSVVMVVGCFLESLGFLGRLLLKGHPARQEYFSLYLVGTVLGPSFFEMAVFLILPHIIAIHGERVPKCKPLYALVLFSSLVGLVVVLEVAGAVSAVLSPSRDMVCRYSSPNGPITLLIVSR
jgi:RTA1 like protein